MRLKRKGEMLKSEWKFEYTGSKLADAARAKIAYHDERIASWSKRREEIVATIRAEGIEVDEKIALAYRSPKARDWDHGGDVMIRNDLRRDLIECFKKLAYHTELRDTFDGWRQVLEANPEHRLSLQIDDWLFFFGKDTGREE
jgi:hypothetical protein